MFKVRRRSGVFTVNFKHISPFVLVFLVLTLNMQLPAGIELECNLLEIYTIKFALEAW